MTDKTLHAFAGVALCAVLLLGGALRVRNLGRPALIEDELFHVFGAVSLLESGKPTLPSGVSYTRAYPFTYLVSSAFRRLGVSEFSARLFPVLFGLMAILLTFLLANALAGPGVGLAAAAFMAIAPFGVVLSRYCRMYTLHQSLYLIALGLFFLAFETREGSLLRRTARIGLLFAAWAACFALDMKIHALAVFFFAGVFGYAALMTAGEAWRSGWRSAVRTRYGFCAAALLGGLLAGLAVPEIRGRLVESFLWVPEWSRSNVNEHLFYHHFFARQHPWTWALVLPGLAALAWRRPRSAAYLGSALLFPVLALSVFPLKSERYVFHLYPIYLMLLACGLLWVLSLAASTVTNFYCRHWRAFRERSGPAAGMFASVAVGTMLVLLPLYARARQIPDMAVGAAAGVRFQPWKEVGDALRRHAAPGEMIIASRTSPVKFYAGRVDYSLNRMAQVEIRQSGVTDASGRLLDYTSGARYLSTLEELKEAVGGPRGAWLVIEASLLDPKKERLSREEIGFLQSAFETAGTTSDASVLIMRRREAAGPRERTKAPTLPKFVARR